MSVQFVSRRARRGLLLVGAALAFAGCHSAAPDSHAAPTGLSSGAPAVAPIDIDSGSTALLDQALEAIRVEHYAEAETLQGT